MERNSDMTNYIGLSGLIFACPFGEKTGCCPFGSIQKMSVENRIEYIESLSNNQITSLLNKHSTCLKHREFSTKHNSYVHASSLMALSAY